MRLVFSHVMLGSHGNSCRSCMHLVALQEDPQVFDIDTSERPKRRRINMLRKEQTQESGSSGYRRIPPEPLEMQEKREHESDNLS